MATEDYSLPYSSSMNAASDIKYELFGIVGVVTYVGASSWDWGSSSFNFNSEGWFGMDTGSGGADKLGHLYSSYVITECLTHRLYKKNSHIKSAAKYASFLTFGTMLYVEIFDGFSADHGFSYEDLTMNTLGIGISYLRSIYPSFKEKLDLRISYQPSEGMEGFHPITDYSGMTYIAALKLNGFDAFKSTPLKYLELHTGYYTRGFQEEDRAYTDTKTTSLYVGVAFNFDELIFKPFKTQLGKPGEVVSTILHYYQLPNTYTETTISKREQSLN